jgi:hypothetical protein
VVTVTFTVPGDPAGDVTVMEVGETTVSAVPGVLPKLAAVAPVKLVPVSVTAVPPAVVPDTGETAVTDGVENTHAAPLLEFAPCAPIRAEDPSVDNATESPKVLPVGSPVLVSVAVGIADVTQELSLAT